jgi:two-component system sensor histidine kinase ChvG
MTPAAAMPRIGNARCAAARRGRLGQRILASHLLAPATVALLALAVPSGPGLAGAAVALAAVAVGLACGVFLTRRVAAPGAELLAFVEAMRERQTRGRPDRSPVPHHGDEIDRLSAGLGALVSGLFDRVADLEDFAADVAHEIRNPLASLRVAAEALRRAEGEQRDRLLGIIEQDVARLDRLVGEILRASRLDAELVQEEATEFDLREMIRGVVDHLSAGAKCRGTETIADLPDGPMPYCGLEARLAQVVVNLVENAISFCDEGDAIRVWLRRRGDRLLFVVEDTGPGIPDGAAEKIFRRFYSHRPQAGGHSGLGLAISRQIVEAHGGTIWAENIRPTESDILSDPLGTRFIVVLPS